MRRPRHKKQVTGIMGNIPMVESACMAGMDHPNEMIRDAATTSTALTVVPTTPVEKPKRFVPTSGTIVSIVAFKEPVSFIVPMTPVKVINFILGEIENNRAWSSNLIRYFLGNMPTMPAPQVITDLTIVKVDPNNHTVSWTSDHWCSWEDRTYDMMEHTWSSGSVSTDPTDPAEPVEDEGDPVSNDPNEHCIGEYCAECNGDCVFTDHLIVNDHLMSGSSASQYE